MEIKSVTNTWTQLSTGNCAVKNFGTQKIHIGFGVTAPTTFTYDKCFELEGDAQSSYIMDIGVWAITQSGTVEVNVQVF